MFCGERTNLKEGTLTADHSPKTDEMLSRIQNHGTAHTYHPQINFAMSSTRFEQISDGR